MKRDEAVGALRDLFEARDKMANLIQGGYDDYAKEAEEAFVEIRERILAALTGSERPEVDLRKEIMNIQVDEKKIRYANDIAHDVSTHENDGRTYINGNEIVRMAYKLGHRDARHAAAEIAAGRWRKVEP